MEFPKTFYAATKEYTTYEKHVPAPYIRRTFSIGDVSKAEVLVSGLGFYDLFLNGKRITKGLLAPYISNPDDVVYFDRYDVTALLQSGENAIGLLLGNGMQNCPGGRVWDFDIARFRGVPRFALRLTATLKSGEMFTLDADERFRTAPSAILFDDLRSGVFYDARREDEEEIAFNTVDCVEGKNENLDNRFFGVAGECVVRGLYDGVRSVKIAPSDVESMKKLLRSRWRPDAFVCVNDEIAVGIVETLKGIGVGVPEDVAVVGFDDVSCARQCVPPLTTVRQPSRQIAQSLIKTLLFRIRSPDAPPQEIYLESPLVCRGTA